ncbi:WecB/TagA/CpsF family glycosyltransferase [Paenibacillus sp. CC-CFT747]|nr:WecB/TagA/CpsF family glycosyltransferase [Paenibacillus sp. CC-CFT747]
MNIPKVSIFGVPFSKLDFQDTIKLLCERIRERRTTQVITANPIMVMTALENPAYMAMMKRAEIIVPDGAGVVWAANYVGNPVAEKVAGIDLLHELLRIGENEDWKVFLLGTSPEVIQVAASRLKDRYPRIRLVGVRDGYFKSDQDEEVIREITAAEPDLLFVGRGADTQEPWIDRYKDRLHVPVIMGVGGSFDIMAGRLKRAPKLFIKLRLEWFYRLLQEPARYKRMLVLPKFAMKVMREKENVQKT